MEKRFYIYILTNQANEIYYVGVTSDLVKRIYEHRESLVDGFTKQYQLKKLVYYEIHDEAEPAIRREKRIKRWRREWKEAAITKMNPGWQDLYDTII